MSRWILALATLGVFWVAASASAQSYPGTLIDVNCTDIYSSLHPVFNYGSGAFREVSGSPNSLCDTDNRILTGAITVDTLFGPIWKKDIGFAAEGRGISVNANSTAPTAGNWKICIHLPRPYEPGNVRDVNTRDNGCTNAATGATDQLYWFGNPVMGNGVSVNQSTLIAVSDPFWILLDLVTTTSWTGDLALVVGN